MMAKTKMIIIAGLLPFLVLSACRKDSDVKVESWAARYSQIASDFVRGFMTPQAQPDGGWEASYAFIQHYERTRDAAETSVEALRQMHVPSEAAGVHSTTIQVLSEIRTVAEDAIRDVRNASNRALFQAAIARYSSRLRQQSQRLENATQGASPRVREQLENYTSQLF